MGTRVAAGGTLIRRYALALAPAGAVAAHNHHQKAVRHAVHAGLCKAALNVAPRLLTSGEAASDIPLLSGWRYEAVGKVLLDVVKNGAKVQIEWNEGSLRTARG